MLRPPHHKRRRPWIGTPPATGTAPVARKVPAPLVVRREGERRGGVVVQVRLPRPGSAGVAGGVLPPHVVRSDVPRGGRVYRVAPPLAPRVNVPGGVLPPKVVRQDVERGGRVVRVSPPLAPKVNVPGGVLPPRVVRRDVEREGRVFWERPFLKAPPPPVAGGVIPPRVVRRDFWRGGLVYLERPRLVPPPPAIGPVWTAPARGLVWTALARSLSWSATVTSTLTKRSGETRQFTMDFSALPDLASVSISSVASVLSTALTPGVANLTLTNPAVGSSGKSATVYIAGGVSGATYQVAFTVNLPGGVVLEEFGYLLVEDE